MANMSTVPIAPVKELLSSDPSARPRMTSQSSSLPSTPRQHARDLRMPSRTPSPGHKVNGGSPRSASSESNRPMPALRLAPSACRFMSTQTSRRRIPYTIGTDLLENVEHKVKKSLDPNEEKRLTENMRELYNSLLPSVEDQSRRQQVVEKLHKILSEEWPGKDIQVSVFGSSGNLLCTNRSDVDVCVVMKEIDTTCVLADVLARRGMQKVTCVHAKAVPIVKIWDPELKLACDLNLNNHVAVKNTRMVRTFVQLDHRVRPLAMIVKHWTSQRVINEASGGTLSSYTWTLLLINFLQTRRPPILPVLTLRDYKGQPRQDLSEDLELLRGFGEGNKETLGELLFHFFRRYGHEIDYQTDVISVRKGRLLTKEEKNWQLATNNMLCVEEPFNTDRNLANTADDTAFRGLHLEFREAFERIAEGRDLESGVFERFTFPTGEPKTVFERPQSHARPILSRSHSQSLKGGNSGGGRGGHRYQGGQRTPANGRRASSAAAYGPNVLPSYPQGHGLIYATPDYLMRTPPQDLQAHLQSQHGFPEHLTQLSQQLSREEYQLRQRQLLLTQAQFQQAHALVAGQNRAFSAPYPGRVSAAHAYRNPRTGTVEEPPTTAMPHRGYMYGTPLESSTSLSQTTSNQGTDTNSSSPLLAPAIPFRRTFQRGPIPSSSDTAVRSQSQPARSIGPQHHGTLHGRTPFSTTMTSSPQNARQDFQFTNGFHGQQLLGPFVGLYGQPYFIPSSAVVEPIPREYLGYGFGGAPQFLQYQDQPPTPSAMYDDIRQQMHSGSPRAGTESLASSVMDNMSRTPSPADNYELTPDLRQAVSQNDATRYMLESSIAARQVADSAPLIVNGSLYGPKATDVNSHFPRRRASDSASRSHPNPTISTRPNGELDDVSVSALSQSMSALPLPSNGDTPFRMNGMQTPPWRGFGSSPTGTVSRSKEKKTPTATPPPINTHGVSPASPPRVSSPENLMQDRTTSTMRYGVAPLDLNTGSFDTFREVIHPPSVLLSPVRESPTPSPTASRKIDQRQTAAHVNGHMASDSDGAASSIASAIHTSEDNSRSSAIVRNGGINSSSGLGIGISSKNTGVRSDHHNGSSTTHLTTGKAGDHANPLPRISTNTILHNHANNTSNSWQLATSGRKHKKNRSNANSPQIAGGFPGKIGGSSVEPMPASEAERKGG